MQANDLVQAFSSPEGLAPASVTSRLRRASSPSQTLRRLAANCAQAVWSEDALAAWEADQLQVGVGALRIGQYVKFLSPLHAAVHGWHEATSKERTPALSAASGARRRTTDIR
jgi:hypothetical protein